MNKRDKIISFESLSLTAKVDEIAKLLRKEARAWNKHHVERVSHKSLKTKNSVNLIQQVAKRLRSEVKQHCKKKAA